MSAPKRIQMSRQRPWRAENPDAVIVARPSKWGNPFAVGKTYAGFSHVAIGETIRDRAHAVDYYRRWLKFTMTGINREREAAVELRGRDLACWCPLVDEAGNRMPCHADVLLELANPGWTP